MFFPRIAAAAVLAAAFALPASAADDPFKFKDGDRVVFLGGTLIEREQKYGWWELDFTLANVDKNVTFRNLGWSGDTVFGESRNGFDQSPKGFERLVELTKELKPTVVVVCYGQNESFDGPAGVDKFTKGLEKLLDAIAPTRARIVLMSPTPFDNTGPAKDAEAKNKSLALYRDAIKVVAMRRSLAFIDVFRGASMWSGGSAAFTENGIHLSTDGYETVAAHAFTGMVSLNSPLFWKKTANTPEANALRAKIVEKNQLFFYRWRPQNETYLFGFRKHEQGRNAVEVAEFDPLVAAAEQQIQKLKKAVPVTK